MPNGHGWHQCHADPPLKRPGLSLSLSFLSLPSRSMCVMHSARRHFQRSDRQPLWEGVTRRAGWAQSCGSAGCHKLWRKTPSVGHGTHVTIWNVKNDESQCERLVDCVSSDKITWRETQIPCFRSGDYKDCVCVCVAMISSCQVTGPRPSLRDQLSPIFGMGVYSKL